MLENACVGGGLNCGNTGARPAHFDCVLTVCVVSDCWLAGIHSTKSEVGRMLDWSSAHGRAPVDRSSSNSPFFTFKAAPLTHHRFWSEFSAAT